VDPARRSWRVMNQPMLPSATATLSTFAATLDPSALPSEVRHAAARLLLDTVGCMLGATRTGTGQLIERWAHGEGSAGSVPLVGFATGLTPMLAAYANGRLAALLDADETYPSSRQTSHLAAATVAAALALAQARGRDGPTLVAGIVAGYEVGARLSNSLVPPSAPGTRGLRAGWGPGSVIAATAAAGRVAGLTAAQLAHAIGLAGLHVGPAPLKWTEVRPAPMAKSADAGWHAMTAVAAVEQAELGMTGYDTILDGETGLWRALGYAECDEDALVDRLGERWIILDAALKRWPCQYWMHPALTALDRVLARHRIAADTIMAIRLATNAKSFSAKFHDPDPPGEIDRAFSFPHAAAMLATGVAPGPAWLEDEPASRSDVRRLRGLIEVVLHRDADRVGDLTIDHQLRVLPASATVRVAGGGFFSADTRMGDGAPWSDETRLSDEALILKFTGMAVAPTDHPLQVRGARELASTLLDVESATDLSEIVLQLPRATP
jgi:2-methylcitrate dehydratase PrpD